MRTRLGAGPIEPTVQNGCQPQADQDWLRCVAQMDLHPAVRQFLNTFHAVEVHDRLTVNPNELLAQSKDALDNLIAFAKSAESPRAFEVVSGLIKTTADVAKNLSDLTAGNRKPDNQTNTQNNIFVGSTAELQKLLKDTNKNHGNDSQE